MKTINIYKIARKNILDLKPYSSARNDFTGKATIFLDANECPFGKHNRYPDPTQLELKELVSQQYKAPIENIFIGNGSDEVIDIAIRVFCEPGKDKILTFTPTYGMYEFLAGINNIEVLKNPLDNDFQIDFQLLEKTLSENKIKMIFVCSPNNPTANIIHEIDKVISMFNGIIFIDEAYIEFANYSSYVDKVLSNPNIIVSRTLSKAWGLAGARTGLGFASADIISLFNKSKYPYNVSTLNQKEAINALKNINDIEQKKQIIIKERDYLIKDLGKIDIVKKVYPSDSNFILIEVDNAQDIYSRLIDMGIIVRDRDSAIKNCLRISVGTPYENRELIFALSDINRMALTVKSNNSEKFTINDNGSNISREAALSRKTMETSIDVLLTIDGSGISNISTGLNFFDHMLEQIAKHGNLDISIIANGDLETDEHHTVEDVAIILGEAFYKALGNKKGIERYGFLLPMDESLAQVALDFGGRPYLAWEVDFKREMIGDMPTELFMHFFKSFSDNAKCNINIKAEGGNDHHKAEAIFKAFARSIKQAVKKTDNNNVPSTKGVL